MLSTYSLVSAPDSDVRVQRPPVVLRVVEHFQQFLFGAARPFHFRESPLRLGLRCWLLRLLLECLDNLPSFGELWPFVSDGNESAVVVLGVTRLLLCEAARSPLFEEPRSTEQDAEPLPLDLASHALTDVDQLDWKPFDEFPRPRLFDALFLELRLK